MTTSAIEGGGCGSGHCGCASAANTDIPTINGVALHAPGERLPPEEMLERAHGELLRQAAVQRGWLPAQEPGLAPALTAEQRAAIEAMIDEESRVPAPDEQACRRHYEAHKQRFIVGQARHVRHILFAVTPGVDVHRLAQRAETALLELT